MKNILIVGGTGVLSYAVVNEALKKGFNVTCINRGKSKTQTLPPEVEIIIANYHQADIIKTKLEGRFFDSVIDVLCYSEKEIEYSVSLFKDICKQYIFISSCAVYNKGNGDYACNEDSQKINPVWEYSVNKWKCEEKLIELAKQHNLTYTIVRPAVTYGNTRIPYGITPEYGYHGTLIFRLLNKKPIILWDGGEAYSTITRVEDFAIGVVGLLGNKEAYNEAYHIVGDERYKWKDVINELANLLNVTPVYVNLTKEEFATETPKKRGEILGGRGISQILDNSKIKKAIPNFKTTIPLREGLKMTLDYYISKEYLNGIDYNFDGEWDRIAKKYSHIKPLGFIDYLKQNKRQDRLTYWLAYNKENLSGKICNLAIRSLRKIKRLTKR